MTNALLADPGKLLAFCLSPSINKAIIITKTKIIAVHNNKSYIVDITMLSLLSL